MKIGTNKKTQEIMSKYNIKTKKKFGQNFLTDTNTLNAIISRAEIDKNDTVVEIGAGIGALTELLCENAKYVYSFEIDNSLFDYLSSNLVYDNLSFIFKDFLKCDLNSTLPSEQMKVVANLPYYITTPILFKILDSKLDFYEIYVMMQKEVGKRLGALPRTKDYNALSVVLQVNYDIDIIMNVSRNVFVPSPNVDSVVVKLVKHSDYVIANEDFFNEFVHDCFTFKRKNLRNNLKKYDIELIEEILQNYGYSLRSRAEEISVSDYVKISNDYYTRSE